MHVNNIGIINNTKFYNWRTNKKVQPLLKARVIKKTKQHRQKQEQDAEISKINIYV